MAAEITWTDDELKEFDRITLMMSNRQQMTRIEGRLAIKHFIDKHGAAKCDAMFSVLVAKDG